MKKLVLTILSAVAFATAFLSAATYTRQTARVVRFQCDPVYNGAGAVTSAPIQSFLVQTLVNDADATDVRDANQLIPVTFDLLDPTIASTNITAAGKTVTYQQLAALMRQAVLDRANAAGVQ